MATIFTVNYPYGSNYEMKVEATESKINNSSNTSLVTAQLYIRRKTASSNGTYNFYGTAWNITIDGTKRTGNSTWDLRNTSEWKLIGTASKTITHNSDGSKKITISASHTGNSGTMGTASGSGQMTLTTIPREASITSNINWTIANTQKLTLKNDGNFNVTLNYYVMNESNKYELVLSKTTSGAGSKTISFTSANQTAFYNKLTTRNNATYKIDVLTYNGTTKIGATKTKTGTISVGSANPVFSNFEYKDTNTTTVALTGDNQTIIGKYSNVQVSIPSSMKMTAQKQATAKLYRANCGKQTTDITYSSTATVNGTLNKVNAPTINVSAVDSRNNQTLVTKVFDYIDYTEPVVQNIKFERKDGNGTTILIVCNGTYANVNFGTKNNTVKSIKYRRKAKNTSIWSDWSEIISKFAISNGVFQNASANELTGTTWDFGVEYDVQIRVYDELSNSQVTNFEVNSGQILMSALKGKGVCFGNIYDEQEGGLLQIDGVNIEGTEWTSLGYGSGYEDPRIWICSSL